MGNFYKYCVDKRGKTWYICRDCGNKEQYCPACCPVCENKVRNTRQELIDIISRLGAKK